MFTRKQLTRKISGIAKRNAALRDDIQEVLIHTAGHALQSRDVSFFTQLFNAVVGQDRKAIAAWAQEYGLAKLDGETGTFKLNKSAHKACDCETGEEYVERLLETAPAWYDGVDDASAVAKALDVAKRIEGVAKALDKAIEDGKAISFSDNAIAAARQHLQRSLANAERTIAMQQDNAPEHEPAPLAIAAE